MQPCHVCGNLGIDAAGYCTNCRTYRGVPQAAGPTSGVPYPTSGTGPYLNPTSGGGYAPTSGAGYPPSSVAPGYGLPPAAAPYPGFPPPAPPRQRSPFVIPLIALSVTLVVLVIAIVVVSLVKPDDTKKTAGGGDSTPTATSLVDKCVVGTWLITLYREDIPWNTGSNVTFTGKGGQMVLKPDGTGKFDFGNGLTQLNGSVSGVAHQIVFSGTLSFSYRTVSNTVTYSNMTSEGKGTLTRNDTGASNTFDLATDIASPNYTCSGNSFVETATRYRIEMSRVNS